MEGPVCCLLLFVLIPGSFSASQMDQLSWVTTSRCRASCVEEYLSWAQEDPASLSENDCIEDYGGCFTCWRMCELLVADLPRWSYWCQEDVPESQCSSGCRTACDFINNTETVYYAEEMFEPEIPQVDFYNDSALTFSVQNPLPRGHISWGVVFLVYYKHAARTQWTFFLSTFEVNFPIYGQYNKYTNLVFQIKAVSEDGVIALNEVDIEQLLSRTPGTMTSTASVITQESSSREIAPLSSTRRHVTIIGILSSSSTVDTKVTSAPKPEFSVTGGGISESSTPSSTLNKVLHTQSVSLTTEVSNNVPDSLTIINIAAIAVICSNLLVLAAAFLFFYNYIRKEVTRYRHQHYLIFHWFSPEAGSNRPGEGHSLGLAAPQQTQTPGELIHIHLPG